MNSSCPESRLDKVCPCPHIYRWAISQVKCLAVDLVTRSLYQLVQLVSSIANKSQGIINVNTSRVNIEPPLYQFKEGIVRGIKPGSPNAGGPHDYPRVREVIRLLQDCLTEHLALAIQSIRAIIGFTLGLIANSTNRHT